MGEVDSHVAVSSTPKACGLSLYHPPQAQWLLDSRF